MPCDGSLWGDQTVTQRKEEVRKKTTVVDKLIAAGKVKVKVGPQGAVTFIGIPDSDRVRMTDGCIYRMLSRTGSVATRLAIQKAEQIAGRAIDRKVVAQGLHSHDGGSTWHPKG